MKFLNWIISLFKKKKSTVNPVTPPPVIEVPKDIPEGINLGRLSELKVGAMGVDISHHNKNVDLATLVKNVDFIYMKATEGGAFVSSVYHGRMDTLLKLNARVGAYHYYRTNVNWLVQAQHFVKHIRGNIAPVLDVEAINNKDFYSARHTVEVLKIVEYVEKMTGYTPIIYGGYYFFRDEVKPSPAFARFPFWISWYTSDYNKVKTPAPWVKPYMWQYTETGTVVGVVGNVDINVLV